VDDAACELRNFVRDCGFDPEAPTAVVCHDAGGADIVSRVARDALRKPIVHAEGPARAVFSAVLPHRVAVEPDLAQAIARSAQVITGTGWQTDVERQAIRGARSAGVPVASVLDHWVHYRERFIEDGSLMLPDQLWVGDAAAFSVARDVFPGADIRQFNNPKLLEDVNRIREIRARSSAGDERTALFLSDNVTDFAYRMHGAHNAFGFTQSDALRAVACSVRTLDPAIERIVVRPHPSEDAEDLRVVMREPNPVPMTLSHKSLAEDLAQASIALGLRSAALYLAKEVGIRAVSCIPASARGYTCPEWGLECLEWEARPDSEYRDP
jgi:hypothetical protein